jgi:hypothetical protein
MSKSPLSGAFADSSATTKKKNKKNGAILLIAGIALTSSIGGVFAANSITLNGDNELEFGQGVALTTVCDADGMDTAISQTLPADSSTEFVARTVTVSRIDSNCQSLNLVVSVLGDNNSVLTSTTLRAPGAATATWGISSEDISAGDVKRISITTE